MAFINSVKYSCFALFLINLNWNCAFQVKKTPNCRHLQTLVFIKVLVETKILIFSSFKCLLVRGTTKSKSDCLYYIRLFSLQRDLNQVFITNVFSSFQLVIERQTLLK